MINLSYPNLCSRTVTPVPGLSVSLNCIWAVAADSRYQVSRHGVPPELFVAVRTHGGQGVMRLEGGSEHVLDAGSLWIFPASKIVSYGCPGDRWDFWWFEFMPHSALPVELCRPVRSPAGPNEKELFRQCWETLRRPASPPQQALASAIFGVLLQQWLVSVTATALPRPHRESMERIIDEMHRRIADRWSVAGMARRAGMGERRFRQVFAEFTGQTPKVFYDRIRLQAADALVQQGLYNISEIADRMGFSSAFHFSKAYRHQFGQPPSAPRKRALNTRPEGRASKG